MPPHRPLSVVRSLPVVQRDQVIVLSSLLGIVLLAWVYLAKMKQDMMPMAAMVGAPEPSAMGHFVFAVPMWAVMMIGMMLPSAAPMILLYTTAQRKRGKHPALMSGVFGAGYLLIWGGFSVAAAMLQLLLARAAVLSPSLALIGLRTAGFVFLLAAAYEFSALKDRCLAHCRSPLAFITQHWRSGLGGALCMGAQHGAFCLGCCWVLMLLLFAVGVMNLVWVAVLSVLVLLQKVLPGGRFVPRATGVVMAMIGLMLIVFPR